MKRPIENLAASVRQRLLNGARLRGEQFELTLVRFASERLLYRLSVSAHVDRFVLKGGLLFLLWSEHIYRPTRDIDLLGSGTLDPASLRQMFSEVCTTEVPDDGLVFDAGSIAVEGIRDLQAYLGLRLTLTAALGTAVIPVQVDVGFGDAVTPEPDHCDLPTMLDHESPRLRMYRRETVVAEKLHAMVDLGERNSRLKDFYDVWLLAQKFAFEGRELSRAIVATFQRRSTAIGTGLPVALTAGFYEDAARGSNWSRYLQRQGLQHAPADFAHIGTVLRSFLTPAWMAIAGSGEALQVWPAGGPWAFGVRRGAGS